jgi:hypothetical protein
MVSATAVTGKCGVLNAECGVGRFATGAAVVNGNKSEIRNPKSETNSNGWKFQIGIGSGS